MASECIGFVTAGRKAGYVEQFLASNLTISPRQPAGVIGPSLLPRPYSESVWL